MLSRHREVRRSLRALEAREGVKALHDPLLHVLDCHTPGEWALILVRLDQGRPPRWDCVQLDSPEPVERALDGAAGDGYEINSKPLESGE